MDRLSAEQIRAGFKAVLGFPPRAADIAIMEMLDADVDAFAEYLWDHWLGEPEHPVVEDVAGTIRKAIEQSEANHGQA